MTVDLRTVVCRTANPLSCNLGKADPDILVLDAVHNQYFGMEHVAGRIWELLAQPTSIGQLVETLCQEFEVDPPRCTADVCQFVEHLSKKGLVQIET